VRLVKVTHVFKPVAASAKKKKPAREPKTEENKRLYNELVANTKARAVHRLQWQIDALQEWRECEHISHSGFVFLILVFG